MFWKIGIWLTLLVTGVILCSSLCQARANQTGFLFGLTLQGLPVTQEQILRQEAIVGVPVRLITFYLQWPSKPEHGIFPAPSLKAIQALGALPCVTWEPMYYDQKGEHMIPAHSITTGAYDPYLISFAQKSVAWGHPFILRLAHEMNIQRYHWGTAQDEYGPQSPALYRRMFRHVVSVFQEQGADNVVFAFCPNAESVPNTSYEPTAGWNTISAYYPGDEYVQVLGIDGYNWGTTQTRKEHGWTSSWQSLTDIFAPAVRELRKISEHKPLIVFETGSARQGGVRDEWLKQGLEKIGDWNIQGMCWFQVDKEVNWSLQWADIPKAGPRLRQLTSPALDRMAEWGKFQGKE